MIATQLPLFIENQPPRARRASRRARFRHVRRDPGVARSVERRDRLGCDLRSAFVSFFAGLTPEQRAEIRSRLAA